MLIEDGRAATGGSAIKAVEVLKEHGVPEERIIFVNLVRVLDLDSIAWVRFRVGSRAQMKGPWKLILRVRFTQIASPEGLKNFCTKYPTTKVVSDAADCGCFCARGRAE